MEKHNILWAYFYIEPTYLPVHPSYLSDDYKNPKKIAPSDFHTADSPLLHSLEHRKWTELIWHHANICTCIIEWKIFPSLKGWEI